MSTIAPTSAQPRDSETCCTSALDGAASPVAQSTSHSTRTRFEATSLQPHLSSLLSSRLRSARWDKWDKEKNRALSRCIAENIKAKMLEVQAKGFKYIVQVQLVENLGQGGSSNFALNRADLACHWEDSDSVVQEMYCNDTLICTVLCFAIRT